MFKRWILPVLLIAALLVTPSMGTHVRAQDSQTLTVFAASSLTNAFEEIATAFEADHEGVDVVFNFAGSSDLAVQLSEGAPADVFASANNKQMTVAKDAGRITAPVRTFAKNRLVLIVPVDNPANIQSLRDLANPGVLLVLAAPDVPVRDYTDTMLEKMVADPAYGEEYRSAVMANLVSEEDNVRQVSAKVALGEADAGTVYLTDVTPDIKDQVIILPIPDAYNTVATYPIAVTDNPAEPELAQAFVDYVLAAEGGQSILTGWGFISSIIPEQPATIALATDGALHVEGQVVNPLTLTAEDLRAAYGATTADVTTTDADGAEVSTTYTGVLLTSLFSDAQVNFNADVKNDKLSMYIVATSASGYQVVVSWGEIDPDYGAQPVMVAYDADGAETSLTLVVPGDASGSRTVTDLVSLSLRDAPPVG
ncbi:MAG TPA: molybdate ABC transporter substrate-binding protein [Aggregatilinea sp.]|uniref:molybdate ABC transporter substrate-binding protein n=1 Tax=Aggregatilinea sp. TaxID=2806333 RepID=UPI002C59EA8A|nr:molybdate ABC transporter substrate-binding protein [Aggregatilinea sp.]HML21325.1 molybdate ABC transporter substrate-binding protein [Aggregatilinea sp.]